MKRSVWLFALLCASLAQAREYEVPIFVEKAEDLYALEQAGEIGEGTLNILVAIIERPIDLNRADSGALYDLPQMTYGMADSIIRFRAEVGDFASVEGLRNVPGLTPDLFAAMAPFVTVSAVVAEGPGDAHFAEPGADLRGKVKTGSIWRRGLDKDPSTVDQTVDFMYPPQFYVRGLGSGYAYFGAGFLVTPRSRTKTSWSSERGQLISQGPTLTPDLDNIYLTWGYSAWRVVVGTFDAGFGERLTFDTTQKRDPKSWVELNNIYEDNQRGRLRVDEGLFGASVSVEGGDTPFGWVDATAFASSQRYDIYQYRGLYFGVEGADNGLLECTADSQCPDGYACGDDGYCYSTRVWDEKDPEKSYRYVTYKDAYRASVFGGNVTLNASDETSIGVTGYRAITDILIGEESAPRFSPSSGFSNDPTFGAIGVNVRSALGQYFWASAEYANTGPGGHGAYARGMFKLPPFGETTLSARYYAPEFDNPFTRADAADDLYLGQAARNEVGGSWQIVATPIPILRIVTDVDLWRRLEYTELELLALAASDPSADDRPPFNLTSRVQVGVAVTRKERVVGQVTYNNRDLEHNGRIETYLNGNDTYGRGERRKFELNVFSDRVPRVRLSLSANLIWEDARKIDRGEPNVDDSVDLFANKFDTQQMFRGRASIRAWEGALLVASAAYWRHVVMLTSTQITNGDTITDRDRPTLNAYLDLQQNIGRDISVFGRLGVLYYREFVVDGTQAAPDPDPSAEPTLGRFAWYGLAKLGLEARF